MVLEEARGRKVGKARDIKVFPIIIMIIAANAEEHLPFMFE